jgi:hypothetical protein
MIRIKAILFRPKLKLATGKILLLVYSIGDNKTRGALSPIAVSNA